MIIPEILNFAVESSVFNELSLIIVVGAVMALIMRLLKQPLIIGHILTGVIAGPALLHVVKSDNTIEIFSKIGITLLLFIIGLGLNPKVVRELGKVAGLGGLLQISSTGLVGFLAAKLLGRTDTEAIFVGAGLAFSSTIIILKLLSDKREQTRLYAKISVGILLIQDIAATFALILTTAHRSSGGLEFGQLGSLLIRGALLLAPLFIFTGYILPHFQQLVAGSQEFLFLFAIGWGFGIAAAFEHYGFSVEIGALFAGVALASLPYAQEVGARLRPLRDFFVIVFFISLGTRLSGGSLTTNLSQVVLFSLVVLLIKPLIIMTILSAMRYTKRTAFKTATALAQISEFSLIFTILAASNGLISNDLIGTMTLVALISITFSSYGIVYSDRLYERLSKYLSIFERGITRSDNDRNRRYELVLFGHKKGGSEFVKVFRSLKKPYIVVDYDPEVIDSLEHHDVNYIYGDAADIEFLEELGLDKAKLIVSVIGDFQTNEFLGNWLAKHNKDAVYICSADNGSQAADLYEHGSSYVMLPHYIGSEKISAFIKHSGLSKTAFRKFRAQHLEQIASQLEGEPQKEPRRLGHMILDRLETPISLLDRSKKS